MFQSSANQINISFESTFTNTVGKIQRCGQLRIELVLLLATLIEYANPAVHQWVIEHAVIDRVLVGVE